MKPDYTTEATELTVPFAKPSILIDVRGKVTLKDTKQVLQLQNDEIELDWYDGKRKYKLAELMLHAFKPHNIPYLNLKDFTVGFKDGNSYNIHPSNLYWKPKYLPIESANYQGTFIIPYYTRYTLTPDFKLIDTKNGLVREAKLDSGYLKSRIFDDYGNRPLIALHRMIAMAFIPVEGDVTKLVVDHINHQKLDNRIDNLQWLTPSEHGVKTTTLGEDEKVAVLCRDVHTGEVITLPSIRGAAAYYGIDYKTMVHRLNAKQRVFYPGVQYQKAEEFEEWRIPSNDEVMKVMNAQRKPPVMKITAVHDDGTKVEFDTLGQAAEFTKIIARTLRAVSEKRVPNRKRNGWSFTIEKFKTGEVIYPSES